MTFTVTDDDGGATSDTVTITVDNVAPAYVAPGNQGGDEASPITVALGTFTDPGDDSPWVVNVDWGDGSPDYDTTAGAPGSLGSQAHTYADNGTYAVTVTVTEDNGAGVADSESFSVTVSNLPPVVDTPVVDPSPSNEGDAVSVSATFNDPAGTTDEPFSCTIDYGDLSPVAATVTGFECSRPSHTYADDGTYTVVAAVTDKDGDTGSNFVTHTVST